MQANFTRIYLLLIYEITFISQWAIQNITDIFLTVYLKWCLLICLIILLVYLVRIYKICFYKHWKCVMPSIGKQIMKILGYSLSLDNYWLGCGTGFSLNNGAKGAKNTPGFILPQLGLFWKMFWLTNEACCTKYCYYY